MKAGFRMLLKKLINRYFSTTARTIIQRFIYLLGAQGIREIFQTALFIIIARQCTTTYGEFMLAMGIGSILLIYSEFGLDKFLVPQLNQKNVYYEKILLQVSLIKSILLCLGLLTLFGFLYSQDYSQSLKHIIIIVSIGMGMDSLVNTFYVKFQVQGLQKFEGYIRSLAVVVGFSYGLVALLAGLPPVLIAFYKILETAVNLIAVIIFMIRRMNFKFYVPAFKGVRSVIPQVMTFGLIELVAIGYNKLNLFFLQHYGNTERIAQYSATWQIIDGVSCILSALLLKNVLYPIFSRLWMDDSEKAIQLVKNTAVWLLGFSVFLMFILGVESDRIIILIFGNNYGDAVQLQRYLVFTIGCVFMQNLSAFFMMGMGKERILLLFYLSGLLLNFILCQYLIPASPLFGAAFSIIVTKAYLALITLFYCHRQIGMIHGRSLFQLTVAVSLGGLLYFLGKDLLLREISELIALMPVLYFLWARWKNDLKTLES